MKASELEKKLGKKKRKTTSELKQVMLVRPDENPNFCLFLGAGASRSSGIRTASQMVNEWRALAYKGLSNDGQEQSPQDMKKWLTEHRDYLAKQSTETLAALRQKYEAVPTHLRMYCGDMDEKDIPIRMILYGKDQIENWSHYQVAKQAGEELPSIDIPEPPSENPASGPDETDSDKRAK